MKIESVILKTVIIINGVEHHVERVDYTDSIREGVDNGVKLENGEDVLSFVRDCRQLHKYDRYL